MQLADALIRPILEDKIRAAWNPTNLRPDAAKTQASASKLPDVRIELLTWQTQPAGRASSARSFPVAHNYRITGRFAYPASGTVNEAGVNQTNAATAVLSSEWPHIGEWTISEEIEGEIRDNAEERTYEVEITFAVEAIVPKRFGG